MGIPSWIAQDPEREWLPDETIDNPVKTLDTYREELRKGQGESAGLRIVIREKPKRSVAGEPGIV